MDPELKEYLDSITSQLDTVRGQNGELKEKIGKLEDKITSQGKTIQDMGKKIDRLEKDKVTLQRKLDESERLREADRIAYLNALEDINRSSGEQLRKQARELEEKYKEEIRSIREANQIEIQGLRQEAEKLRDQLEDPEKFGRDLENFYNKALEDPALAEKLKNDHGIDAEQVHRSGDNRSRWERIPSWQKWTVGIVLGAAVLGGLGYLAWPYLVQYAPIVASKCYSASRVAYSVGKGAYSAATSKYGISTAAAAALFNATFAQSAPRRTSY